MNNINYLIDYLAKERNIELREYKSFAERLIVYRALVNEREAKPISEEYLIKEDEFLQAFLKKNKITDSKDLETSKIDNNKIAIFKGSITRLKIEAIVNATNSKGTGCYIPNHNCVDNQITTYAGVRLRLEDQEKMNEIKKLNIGFNFITKGYNLPCDYIIHTVGPIIKNEVHEYQKKELEMCYLNALKTAKENGIRSIAFPCISTGEYNFLKVLLLRLLLIVLESI